MTDLNLDEVETKVSKLLDILPTLEKSNDEHWTSAGLVKIEAITFKDPQLSVTRAELEYFFPNFNRETLDLTVNPELLEKLFSQGAGGANGSDNDSDNVGNEESNLTRTIVLVGTPNATSVVSSLLQTLTEQVELFKVSEASDSEINQFLADLANFKNAIGTQTDAVQKLLSSTKKTPAQTRLEQQKMLIAYRKKCIEEGYHHEVTETRIVPRNPVDVIKK